MIDKLKYNLIQDIMTNSFSAEELVLIKNKIFEITNRETEKGVVEFTEKELNTMPKNIKKLLLLDKKRCRLRTKKSGENTITYEIRFRRDGYNISACGKTIELAKANFLEKCKTAKNEKDTIANSVPTTFNSFAQFYFESFRKELVATKTLYNDKSRYNKYILPTFKERPIANITPTDCKKLLDTIKKQGFGKTADEIYSLLNVIFKSAINHSLIEKNPLDTLLHIKHERKHGTALTKDEEQRLKTALKGSEHLQAFMILLHTGLRPNELKTAKVDGLFIVAQNSKRKNKKVVYKKIPITDALKSYLLEPLKFAQPYTLRDKLKKILPNHILYDLRTTFYTRCDELGVSAVARDFFVGHSNGMLTDTYRNLSDEYLLKEGEKLNKWV